MMETIARDAHLPIGSQQYHKHSQSFQSKTTLQENTEASICSLWRLAVKIKLLRNCGPVYLLTF